MSEFHPIVRASILRAWSEAATAAENESRLQRALAERLASIIRSRRNKIERCSPVEAGVLALELAGLSELLEVLDASFARRLLTLANLTVDACESCLEADRAAVRGRA